MTFVGGLVWAVAKVVVLPAHFLNMRGFEMADYATLDAKIRTTKGKVEAKRLRKVGSIPAVMYDSAGKSTMIAVDTVAFNKIWRTVTKTTPVMLKIDGKDHLTLIRDVEYNIRNDTVLHADFFEPAEKELLLYKMKVQFSGTPVGVLKGGYLLKHAPEVTIKAPIKSLPERIVIDTTALNIGDSIKVKDLKLDKAVVIVTSGDTELVSISPAR